MASKRKTTAPKDKSAQDCAREMMAKGGNEARAMQFAAGVGARKALQNPRAYMQLARKRPSK